MQSLNMQQQRLPAARHRAPCGRALPRAARLPVMRGAVAEGTAAIIDGKQIAADIRKEIAAEVAQVKAKTGKAPGLAVVLVGSRKDSETYVRWAPSAAPGAAACPRTPLPPPPPPGGSTGACTLLGPQAPAAAATTPPPPRSHAHGPAPRPQVQEEGVRRGGLRELWHRPARGRV
jgi:hypothetical protein